MGKRLRHWRATAYVLVAGGALGCAAASARTDASSHTVTTVVVPSPTATREAADEQPAPSPPTGSTAARDYRSLLSPELAVLAETEGDVDGDGVLDHVLVLHHANEQEAEEELPRTVVVVRGLREGGYELAAQNDRVVFCARCGGMMGDPFVAIHALPTGFSIEHFGGARERWTLLTTFRYDDSAGTWVFESRTESSYDSLAPHQPPVENTFTADDLGHVSFEDYSSASEPSPDAPNGGRKVQKALRGRSFVQQSSLVWGQSEGVLRGWRPSPFMAR